MAIILASQSPRRRELMALLGVPFTVQTADVDETMDLALAPEREVARVGASKAQKIAETAAPGDIVVAADTIVLVDGKILGKPKDEADAARMLRLLSGRAHEVLTGLTVWQDGRVQTETVRTAIHFRPLSEQEIRAYVETGEPMDKAGAYGIQGRASVFVERLEGDYFCVMGLPLCTLTGMLRACGVQILGQ
jgi:septum formation protein